MYFTHLEKEPVDCEFFFFLPLMRWDEMRSLLAIVQNCGFGHGNGCNYIEPALGKGKLDLRPGPTKKYTIMPLPRIGLGALVRRMGTTTTLPGDVIVSNCLDVYFCRGLMVSSKTFLTFAVCLFTIDCEMR